ncbi:MAG: outer membrane beta-barrel family protein [Bacteroidaceae bacterium]|nr:outer membrane beta-barrel family protein [Bacteroidaceae bacterium]
MDAKPFIVILTAIFTAGTIRAQNEEATDSLTRKLQEVVITAKQPATKLVGSTLISTIPGTNLANLGNALDVLAQLPMIKVQDNTASVIGKSNIEIYIDGRPMRDEQELQQLLSSQLKKVELLMAPGATYASNCGAVLKITTRRSFAQGLSLTDQFRLQRRRKWSAMNDLGLSYRIGNWEVFGKGTINRNKSLTKGTTTNKLWYGDKETVVGSSQHNSHPTTTGIVEAGFNYAKVAQSFGSYYRYNPERGDFNNSGTEWLDDYPAISRDIDKRMRSHTHLAALYYENTFADKYLLHFDGDFRQSHSSNKTATTYTKSTTNPDINSTDKRHSTLWAGKLYLKFPLWNGDFTVGTQDSYTCTSLDYQMQNAQVSEYIPSSLTDAKQTSAALFATWSRTLGKFSLSVGARYEYVDYDFKIDGKRDEDVSRRNHLFTPNLSLGYSFNEEAQITLTYKRVTIKPPYSQLTGSLSYVGLHEIEGGNPGLHDENMHDVQLFGMWKGFMLQADFTRSIDTYAYVKQQYPAHNLQLVMHPVNIDVSALNLYLIWSQPLRRWTPNVMAGMYRQWLKLDNISYNKPIFSYDFDNTFSLPHSWTITANVSGRTQGDMHTNRFGATWFTMDVSVGKNFFNKSLTVKLSATDIFNTANNNWTMNTYGVFVDKHQSYDHRGVSLSVIYNFHPHKSKYKGTSAAEAEMKRL